MYICDTKYLYVSIYIYYIYIYIYIYLSIYLSIYLYIYIYIYYIKKEDWREIVTKDGNQYITVRLLVHAQHKKGIPPIIPKDPIDDHDINIRLRKKPKIKKMHTINPSSNQRSTESDIHKN